MEKERKSLPKSIVIEVRISIYGHITYIENKFEGHYNEVKDKFQAIEDEANKSDQYNQDLEKTKADAKVTQDKLNLLTEKSDTFQKLMKQTNTFFSQIKTEMEKVIFRRMFTYV